MSNGRAWKIERLPDGVIRLFPPAELFDAINDWMITHSCKQLMSWADGDLVTTVIPLDSTHDILLASDVSAQDIDRIEGVLRLDESLDELFVLTCEYMRRYSRARSDVGLFCLDAVALHRTNSPQVSITFYIRVADGNHKTLIKF